jgi:glyoxylase-like metal-dependent hydrolase (beta-lactamase superfamily II)
MGRWYRLGELELMVVSDGVLWLDAGAVFGLTPRIMWEPLVSGGLDHQHRLGLGLNCLLVRSQGRTVLVETGCGMKPVRAPGAAGVESTGQLLANLVKEGVGPEDVNVVVNTHLHFDHAGGNTVLEGTRLVPAFPRARYFIQKGEWETAQHPNERTRSTYLAENLEPLADARQVELVEGVIEVATGVRLVPAPGHTPSHAVVEVESGGELAIYVGELAQHPVMLERIAWISAFDVLPLVSLETKKRVVERVLEKQALVVLVHGPYPGLGRLRLEDDRRRWEAVTVA